jgi:hypothetical protein
MYDLYLYLTLFLSFFSLVFAGLLYNDANSRWNTVERRGSRMAFSLCLFLSLGFFILYISALNSHYRREAYEQQDAALRATVKAIVESHPAIKMAQRIADEGQTQACKQVVEQDVDVLIANARKRSVGTYNDGF